MHRSNELNGMCVAAVQEALGAAVARIDQVLLGQEVCIRQCCPHRGERRVILLGRGRRLHRRDELRQIAVTALREPSGCPVSPIQSHAR
jgi:hypothetical protein